MKGDKAFIELIRDINLKFRRSCWPDNVIIKVGSFVTHGKSALIFIRKSELTSLRPCAYWPSIEDLNANDWEVFNG